MTTPTWQATAARRREEIYRAIPKEYLIDYSSNSQAPICRVKLDHETLSPREQTLTTLTASVLLSKIHGRTYSAIEVTIACCKRAAIAHQATNCLAAVMFGEALADAKALDEYMRINQKPKGPLHGLPISLKEHINLTGTPATSGFIAWADAISQSDALIVRVFREAGAVFHVKTTNPQSLMSLETSSNLFGTTLNPFTTHLTSGGSSGGEGALMLYEEVYWELAQTLSGARSVYVFNGGSIRVPSAFCGLLGLKPSVGRLPHSGLSGVHDGMESVIGVVGRMATYVEDLTLFCKVLTSELPRLSEEVLDNCLANEIGVMMRNGVVQPHPPISRCLRETVAALRYSHHNVIPWDPLLHRSLVDCINDEYFLDGGQEYLDVLKEGDEPPTPMIRWVLGQKPPRSWTVSETWKLHSYRSSLQAAYATQWNDAAIDALICPVNPSVASAHNESTYWGYSSVFNILDYSVAVVPTGVVEATDTWVRYPPTSEQNLSQEDAVYREYYQEGQAITERDGPEKYRGAPVALQIVGRRFREEEVLLIAEAVLKSIELYKSEVGNQ